VALSVNNNQTYRLRDLRDNAVPRDRSEPRAPSRRPKFQDSLSHPKAGEVVGEFPAKYKKTKDKPQPKENTLQVAAKRQQPRQAVAALMAKEGISTATKFGARFGAGASSRTDDKAEEKREEQQSAWKGLLDDNDAKPAPEKSASDKGIEERLKRLRDQEKELNQLKKFSSEIDGQPVADYMRKQDQRVLKEAGRLERSSEFSGLSAKEAQNMDLLKKEMAMSQQLNMQYLQMQQKLERGLETLLSNLLKARNETVKNAISGS